MLDLALFESAPLQREPFDHLVVPNFLAGESLARARADFPRIGRPGLFPLSELRYGGAFGRLIAAIEDRETERSFARKFGVDLRDRPLMITVRERCQRKDGRIHTDSACKILTALLYLNEGWEKPEGRLRLLRRPDNLDDMVAEVPPIGGTLVALRRTDNSYHGHAPYEGPRRYVMFNWVTSRAAAARELARHRLSARIKIAWPSRDGAARARGAADATDG